MYRGTPSRRRSTYGYTRNGLTGAIANYGALHDEEQNFNNRFMRRSPHLHSTATSSQMSQAQVPTWQNANLPDTNWQNSHYLGGAATHAQNENLFMSDTNFLESLPGQIVDPVPVVSFINRLHESQRLSTVPTMKEVDRLPASLQSSFGNKQDDWYAHLNKMELDVFQKHAFNSMQCYFAIKASLKGSAQRALYNLES